MVTFSEEQTEVFEAVSKNRLVVVSGPPGSGKTTMIKHIAEMFSKCLVLAPTGSAAERIQQSSGLQAHVISKVEFSADMLAYFRGSVVIIDECSMVSTETFLRIMVFLHPEKIVVFGDHNQLPCCKGEPVLNTLMHFRGVDIHILRMNHRQLDANSALVEALRSLGTESSVYPVRQDDSLRIVECANDAEAISRASKDFSMNPSSQILAFTNYAVQNLNQATHMVDVTRIVCTRNLYVQGTLAVSNGTMGNMFDPDTVVYSSGFVDVRSVKGKFQTSFVSAAAMTTHKAQGNEFEEKGIVVVTSFQNMTVKLLYTALSRFKHLVVVYGTHQLLSQLFSSRFETNVDKEAVDLFNL